MKKNCTNSLLILGLLLFGFNVNAQNIFFKDVNEAACKVAGQQQAIKPLKYRTVALDTTALVNFLHLLPAHD